MKRPAFLLLIALGFFACRKDLPPLVPPTQAVSAQPRFDGIYTAHPSKEARDMLRFVDGGKVIGISTAKEGAVERAVGLLNAPTEACAQGTFTVTDGVLRFRLKSELGDVDYAGSITGDKLTLRWRSDVNGTTNDQEYTFEGSRSKTTAANDTADAGAKPEATGVVGAIEAPVVAPPPALVPEGSAWFCFRVAAAGTGSGGSRCERKLAACEAARKAAAPLRRGAKVGKCARSPNAHCFSVQRAAGGGGASCSMSDADCDAERAGVVADNDSDEVSVSACSER